MDETHGERRLTTILSADVVGYSRLMGKDEAGTLTALKAHRAELMDPKAAQYNGRTIKLMGDGTLMEFHSVVEAVRFAVDVQLAMRARNAGLPEGRHIHYRIGINIGDIIVEGDDIYGDGVNLAARLEGLADPGGICVRRGVRNQVRDRLDLDFDDLGEIEVKNIARPVRAFRIVLDEKAEKLATPTTAAPPAKRRRPWRAAAAAALSLAVLAAAGLAWWQPWAPKPDPSWSQRGSLPMPDKPSIAVMPFVNLGSDREQDHFIDGLTDDLITDLSKISGLFVIARNSVFTYKGQAAKVQDVARDLGVRFVLEGSVRRAGNKLRINAQLIDAAAGHHLWAERYDRDLVDVFAVQEEVVGKIVSALAIELTDREERQLARIPTRDLEAYDHFLRAEQGAYSTDAEIVRQTIAHYHQAIALDAEFAQAYAGLARTFADVLLYDLDNTLLGPVARDAAYKAASTATQLDPDLPRPLSVLGIIQMIDGAYASAVKQTQEAVALAPGDAEAHMNLALVLASTGDVASAVKETEAALRLNPKPAPGFLVIASIIHYLNRSYEVAAGFLEEARKSIPNSIVATDFLAMAYAQLGREEDAKKMVEVILELDSGYSLSAARAYHGHYQRPEDLALLLEGLRKAGLPQWPLGFNGQSEKTLNQPEIEKLTQERTWRGSFLRDDQFFMSFDRDGLFALRTENTIRLGDSKIAGDELCLKSVSHFLGRWSCGPVYRNSTQSTTPSYAYAAGDWLFEFELTD